MIVHVYDLKDLGLTVDVELDDGTIMPNVETCDHRDATEINTVTEIATRS